MLFFLNKIKINTDLINNMSDPETEASFFQYEKMAEFPTILSLSGKEQDSKYMLCISCNHTNNYL